tara:strand:- start:78357 stop:78662 length:306 start_codon:yes stop_codon:yes gene_type:complete
MSVEDLEQEVRARWHAMFSALAAGEDVPPAQRLRTEGMMEALVLLGHSSAEDLFAAMDEVYEQAFETSLAVDYGDDWREFYPFPQIPAMGVRAPVYPSTTD